MFIAQRALPHIRKLDGALAARIHEPVAAHGVELGGCDDLCQLLHVCRLDIHNVEALVLYIQVPQVYPQVVTANERLPVAVHRDAVDVVGVGVGIGSPGYSSNNSVVMGQSGQLQLGSIAELGSGGRSRRSSTSTGYVGGCQIMGQVVLGHNFQRLLKNFP